MSDPVEAARQAVEQAAWKCVVESASMSRVMSGSEFGDALDAYAAAIRSESAGTGLDSVRLGRAIYEAGAMDIAPVDWTATIQAVIAAEYARLSSSDTEEVGS